MSVYVNNITIDTGAYFSRDFYLDNIDGSPLDLTGYTAASQIRKHPDSVNATANFTVAFIDRTNGRIRVSLGRTTTAEIKPGRYMYDVMFTEPEGSATNAGVWSTLDADNSGSYRGYTNSAWTSFMNTYAYSRIPQSGFLSSNPDPYGVETDSYIVTFPHSGSYQIEAAADNVGTVTINGTTFNAVDFNDTNVGVGSIYLDKGNHTITLTQQNIQNAFDTFAGNPVGLAVSITYIGGSGVGKKSIVLEGNILATQDITPQCLVTSYTNAAFGAISEDGAHDSGIGSGLTQITINDIGEYGVVAFGHYDNSCTDLPNLTTKFQDSTYMDQIQNYLLLGGIVMYIGEYNSCGDTAAHNTRLGLLGTSMRLNNISISPSTASLALTGQVASNFPATWSHDVTNSLEVNSGTAIYSSGSNVTVAYEKYGNGAIILVGDSNGSSKTPQNYYSAFRDLVLYG